MITLKADVRIDQLKPQMVLAAIIVNAVYQNLGVKECQITSGNDGIHGAPSLHYSGEGLDFRTKNVPRTKLTALEQQVKLALGPTFDVVLEDVGLRNEHLHVEFEHKR